MKTDRSILEDYLLQFISGELTDPGKGDKFSVFCNDKYNYPNVRSSDILTKRISLSELSDFDIFILFDGILSVCTTPRKKINDYFTDDEINFYSSQKFKVKKKAKFPLKFKMIEVGSDQWIGKTSAKELVDLRNGGIIRYNTNIQRTMRRGIRGKSEEYRIMENKSATRSIRESMQNDTFISNTITLNIPDDAESIFNYNPETMELVIKKANSLDIIDGFHRLIALEQASNMDSKFDYIMELRITNYSESKGQRFVYQEDQKTKMSKIDSDSFNIEDESVKTVKRLNDDDLFILQGKISRNEGLISLGEMAAIVKRIFFYGLNKTESRIKGISLTKELRIGFNNLVECDPRYATERYSFIKLSVVLVGIDWFIKNNIQKENQGKLIEYVLDNIDDQLKTRLKSKSLTGPTIKYINKLLENGLGVI